jgi:hypothetical protein
MAMILKRAAVDMTRDLSRPGYFARKFMPRPEDIRIDPPSAGVMIGYDVKIPDITREELTARMKATLDALIKVMKENKEIGQKILDAIIGADIIEWPEDVYDKLRMVVREGK